MRNEFLKKANLLEPVLHERKIAAVRIGHTEADDSWDGYRFVEDDYPASFQKGESFCIDFGEHCTGYLSFVMTAPHQYPDAPTKLRFRFAETLQELGTPFEECKGNFCRTWLQEEIFIADDPDSYSLRRRYAFRYVEVKIEIAKAPICLDHFVVSAFTSADWSQLKPVQFSERLAQLDKVGCCTLSECMQRVFEDGPKRDRRLWIGDLRLQALVNYETFDNLDLVLRCLYLFAGYTKPGKHTPRCIYINPQETICDDAVFVDYSLMFNLILCDYYEHTADRTVVEELFEIADEQIALAYQAVDKAGIVQEVPVDGRWAFIDWCAGLQKRTSMQGVIIYTLDKMIALCEKMGYAEKADQYRQMAQHMKNASRKYLYNEEKQAFINEVDLYQYSVHSQVWMILSGVLSKEEGQRLMQKVLSDPKIIRPVTPYMHHYVVEALQAVGMKEETLTYIQNYWGQMVDHGADTYWEVFVPGHPEITPYGDRLMNSACHAWSCSPSYFLRKYFTAKEKDDE